jgi:hypothetical protein
MRLTFCLVIKCFVLTVLNAHLRSAMPSDAEITTMADSLLDLGFARHGADFGEMVLDGSAEELRPEALAAIVPGLESGSDELLSAA